MCNDENDFYYDLYKETKLTKEQIRQFKEFENHTDDELEEISDLIFDLAVLAQKIILEQHG